MATHLRLALLVAAYAPAFAGTLVVPNLNTHTAGNFAIPLRANFRIQEVVGGGQFTIPIVITGIRFRAAVGMGPVIFNYSSFTVTLSTTQAYPNTNNGRTLPSTTYANNVGPDAAMVYNTALSGSSPGCAGPDPCPFDLAIPFTTPFSLDPSKGRLLVDIVASGASGTPAGNLDAVTFPNSVVSTVAVVLGGASQSSGTENVGGFVLGLDTSTPLPPLIFSIQNAASNIAPGLPNTLLAQGSIFIIKGASLGPANLSTASPAFQSTSLSGTSVAVTVGTTTVNALMYYTSDGQVAALLPSNTPTGAGMFTVTYNGLTSNPTVHGITASNLGIFTIDSSGQGPGIVTFTDYTLISAAKDASCGPPQTPCGAANPGDTLFIWATGLGPVSGSDAAGAGLGQNMPNIPLTVWIGGVQAPVTFQGRGCCIGEDQIEFTVPNNVPTGCAVPLVVQIGNEISNNVLIPVANGSRNCTPNNAALASVNIEQAVTAGPVTFASLTLGHYFANGGTYEDEADFQFAKISSYSPGTQPYFVSWIDSQPSGTCLVYNNLNANMNPPIGGFVPLDAGSSFTVMGPNGSAPVMGKPDSGGGFSASLSSAGTFLVPGAYTVTGTGGADVGRFSANITFPTSPTLVSPQNGTMVARSKGMTVTWTGGDPNGNVQMVIQSATDSSFSNGATAICTAPAGPGTFTIPPSVLLALPAGGFAGFVFSPALVEVPFTATGLSLGVLGTQTQGTGFGYGAGTGSFALQ